MSQFVGHHAEEAVGELVVAAAAGVLVDAVDLALDLEVDLRDRRLAVDVAQLGLRLGVELLGFVVVVAHAVRKYDLVAITPSLAAPEIIGTMADALFVCGRDGRIEFANDGIVMRPNLVKTVRSGQDLKVIDTPEPERLSEAVPSGVADQLTAQAHQFQEDGHRLDEREVDEVEDSLFGRRPRGAGELDRDLFPDVRLARFDDLAVEERATKLVRQGPPALGVRLLQRSSRRIGLTAVGREVRLEVGPIRTGMTALIPDEAKRKFARRRVPVRRYGDPEEVAHATLSLALPAMSYCTGAVLVVDGGFTTKNN